MKTIPCACGQEIWVNDEDYERLKDLKWYCSREEFIYTVEDGKNINIARFIIPIPDGFFPDHKNTNAHDNQRLNLRVANKFQNAYNRKLRTDNVSGYKGVHRLGQCYASWNARINVEEKRINLGCFGSPEDAARAYNEAAEKYHGKFARLNVINSKKGVV